MSTRLHQQQQLLLLQQQQSVMVRLKSAKFTRTYLDICCCIFSFAMQVIDNRTGFQHPPQNPPTTTQHQQHKLS
jgi:hypothetical protein